ncbi:MAG: hypothetical protein ACRD35_08625 [Candidatus Acidiferrales bacterium]
MHKRILFLAMALVVVVGLAWAGGGEKGQMKQMTAAEHAAKLQAKLGLTDAQTQQVRALFEEFQPRLEALHARYEKGEDVKAEKSKLKEERTAKLKTILTAEQWTKYEAMMAEHAKQKK